MIRTLALIALATLATPAAADRPRPLADADFPAHPAAEIALGHLLFWDPILSGNRNIACATCHHPRFGSGDGLPLGLGEGGAGLGPARAEAAQNRPEQRIPRNAPALWNTGSTLWTVMFHDGRIEVDPSRPGGLRTPLETEMTAGFASLLSAQTMFPVLSNDEMAGHYQENEVSALVRQGRITGPDGAWAAIAARVAAIPDYAARFAAVYPDTETRGIGFTDISNAIAAYVTADFRSDTAPFDAALRGTAPLPAAAQAGADLFYGRAGCADCHSGPLLTDFGFHAMGDPQLGPGKAERFERHQRDTGRQKVSNRPQDAYAFRTPSLRNVALTGPWGHAGAFSDLTAYLRHHADPAAGLAAWDGAGVALPALAAIAPGQGTGRPDHAPEAADLPGIRSAVAVRAPVPLSRADLAALGAFLDALTDPVAVAGGRLGIPAAVPSGLPVDR